MTNEFKKWFHELAGFDYRSDHFRRATTEGDHDTLVAWLEEAFEAGAKNTPQTAPANAVDDTIDDTWRNEIPAYLGLIVCGSRYFSSRFPDIIPPSAVAKSDIDLFAPDTTEIRLGLIQAGFVENLVLSKSGYFDSITTGLFEKLTKSGLTMQVTLKSDAELYRSALLGIDGVYYRDHLWKSGPNKPTIFEIQNILEDLFRRERYQRLTLPQNPHNSGH